MLGLTALVALPLGAQQDKCLDATNERQKKWTAAGKHSFLEDVQHNEDIEIARTWCYLWETHGEDRLNKGIDFGRALFTGDGGSGKDPSKKLQPDDVASVVASIVTQPPQSFISEVLLRPTQKP